MEHFSLAFENTATMKWKQYVQHVSALLSYHRFGSESSESLLHDGRCKKLKWRPNCDNNWRSTEFAFVCQESSNWANNIAVATRNRRCCVVLWVCRPLSKQKIFREAEIWEICVHVAKLVNGQKTSIFLKKLQEIRRSHSCFKLRTPGSLRKSLTNSKVSKVNNMNGIHQNGRQRTIRLRVIQNSSKQWITLELSSLLYFSFDQFQPCLVFNTCCKCGKEGYLPAP